MTFQTLSDAAMLRREYCHPRVCRRMRLPKNFIGQL